MAFSDPIKLTLPGDTTESDMYRISSESNKSVYSDTEGKCKLTISHTYNRRSRRVVRLDWTKTGPDPLFTDQNQVFSSSVYVVLDQPKAGFTTSELADLGEALGAFLTSGSNAERWVIGEN